MHTLSWACQPFGGSLALRLILGVACQHMPMASGACLPRHQSDLMKLRSPILRRPSGRPQADEHCRAGAQQFGLRRAPERCCHLAQQRGLWLGLRIQDEIWGGGGGVQGQGTDLAERLLGGLLREGDRNIQRCDVGRRGAGAPVAAALEPRPPAGRDAELNRLPTILTLLWSTPT